VATGAADDEAAWLLARVRTGDLAPLSLRLAAHLGHAGARLAVGVIEPDDRRDVDSLRRWAAGLLAFGRPVCARAGLALARACLPGLKRAPARLDRAVVEDLVLALEEAVASPTRSALDVVRAASARAAADPRWTGDAPGPRAARARLVAIEAANVLSAPTGTRAADAMAQTAAWAAGGVDVRRVVRAELEAWALGGPPSSA
jgi:hypothetical protein